MVEGTQLSYSSGVGFQVRAITGPGDAVPIRVYGLREGGPFKPDFGLSGDVQTSRTTSQLTN